MGSKSEKKHDKSTKNRNSKETKKNKKDSIVCKKCCRNPTMLTMKNIRVIIFNMLFKYLQHIQALCKELMTNYHKIYV